MRRRILALIAVLAAVAALTPGPSLSAAQERRPKPPIINPTGGQYTLNQPVRVSIRSEPGSRIVYTLDGSYPEVNRGIKTDSHLASFDLPPGDVTVMAIAVMPGMRPSHIQRAIFTRSGQ